MKTPCTNYNKNKLQNRLHDIINDMTILKRARVLKYFICVFQNWFIMYYPERINKTAYLFLVMHHYSTCYN